MSGLKNTVCLLALFAIFYHTSGASLDQNRLGTQNEQDGALNDEEAGDETVSLDDPIIANRKQGWTTCDWRVAPKFSCNDCNTRVICKPMGGILKYCGGNTPYCRNGFCSAVPSDECSVVEESEDDNSDVDDVSKAKAVGVEASEVKTVKEMSKFETSGTNLDQSRMSKQNEEDDALSDKEVANETVLLEDPIIADRKQGWTTCDWRVTPKFSCNDCTTRVICKPIGGILKHCGGNTPYCSNGFCSAVPSNECSIVEESEADNSDFDDASEAETVEEKTSEVKAETSGTNLDQSRVSKQNEEDDGLTDEEVAGETISLDDLVTANRKHGWATCDWKGASKFSCSDCNTRVICKKIGSIPKPCGGNTPYCRNGFCSAVPSDECAIVEEIQDGGEVEIENLSEAEAVEEGVSEVEVVTGEVSEVETVDEEISEMEGEVEQVVDDIETVEEESSEGSPLDEEIIEVEAIEEEPDNTENVEGVVIEVTEDEENQDETSDEAPGDIENEEKENIDIEAIEDVTDVESIEKESEVEPVEEEVSTGEDLREQLH